METSVIGNAKGEFDDSGCIQDDISATKMCLTDECETHLLSLSDDVLLYILRHCGPMELKALAYTCPRLARLSLEHSLWHSVDARNSAFGCRRLRWLLAYALGERTTELLLTGCVNSGCEENKYNCAKNKDGSEESNVEQTPKPESGASNSDISHPDHIPSAHRQRACFHISTQPLPKLSSTAPWPDNIDEIDGQTYIHGPVFTLSPPILSLMREKCPNLVTLCLDYCNINCKATNLGLFPPKLKKLSLRGTRCYNMPMDKTFLSRIHDYLPELEYLDVSECEWFEPSSLLPLSKLPKLLELHLVSCRRLAEFVAYASLAARYGFRSLELVDLRGSPVGDSEVSALGWVPNLKVVRISPEPPSVPEVEYQPSIQKWELEEPEFLTKIQQTESWEEIENTIDEEQKEDLQYDHPCDLRIVVSLNDLRQQTEENERHRLENAINNIDIQNPRHIPRDPNPPNNIQVGRNISGQVVRNIGGISIIKLDNNSNKESENPPPENKVVKRKYKSDPDDSDTDSDPDDYVPIKKSKEETNEAGTSKNEVHNKQGLTVTFKRNANESEGSDNSEKRIKRDDNSENKEGNKSWSVINKNEKDNSEINAGASTSKDTGSKANDRLDEIINEVSSPSEYIADTTLDAAGHYVVTFRKSSASENVNNNQNNQNNDNDNAVQAESRHHVLYVSVGQQLQAVYRVSREHQCQRHNDEARLHRLFYSPSTHIDREYLVTDSGISRFGRSDDENINYVHIGRNVVVGDVGNRPDRSNLRELIATGFRHITDRSLVHLATAAPHLRLVDFTGTSVTRRGVEIFKGLRPDCEVIYSVKEDE